MLLFRAPAGPASSVTQIGQNISSQRVAGVCMYVCIDSEPAQAVVDQTLAGPAETMRIDAHTLMDKVSK